MPWIPFASRENVVLLLQGAKTVTNVSMSRRKPGNKGTDVMSTLDGSGLHYKQQMRSATPRDSVPGVRSSQKPGVFRLFVSSAGRNPRRYSGMIVARDAIHPRAERIASPQHPAPDPPADKVLVQAHRAPSECEDIPIIPFSQVVPVSDSIQQDEENDDSSRRMRKHLTACSMELKTVLIIVLVPLLLIGGVGVAIFAWKNAGNQSTPQGKVVS